MPFRSTVLRTNHALVFVASFDLPVVSPALLRWQSDFQNRFDMDTAAIRLNLWDWLQ